MTNAPAHSQSGSGATPRRPRTDGGRLTQGLRDGGTLSVDAEGVVIDRDGESVQVDLEEIVEVSLESFDYFLGILSLGLIGFGLLSFERDVLLALVFTALGVASFYRTYRRRRSITFRINGRAKPLVVYPVDAQGTYDSLQPYVEG